METELAYPKRITATNKKSLDLPFNILVILALCTDLFTPYLIWKGYIPAQIRWVSHAAVALMLALSITRMILFRHFPKAFLLILGMIFFWAYVALARGQGITATVWGIWLLFQYPFVGLFVYLEPNRSIHLTAFLRKAGLVILLLQLGMQLYQYAGGQAPGDNLAGLFGKNGTGDAAFFIILINCLFLGHWIQTKRWAGLAASLVLGGIANVLAEVKLYPFVIAALSIVAILIFVARTRSLLRLLVYLLFVIAVLVGFLSLYNYIIPSAQRRPLEAYITNPALLEEYLNATYTGNSTGSTRTMIGRGYALKLGWDTLDRGPVTMLFGYGIGARSESQSLQTTGIGFASTDIGIVSGTSLLVEMQELGLVGMAIFGGFLVWVIILMARDILRYPHSPAVELRYALLLFSILWPVWIWYASVLHMRAVMALYWMLLGYVLAETWRPLAKSGVVDREKAR